MPLQHVKATILDRLEQPFLDALWVGFVFNEELATLIHAVKYRQMPRLGIALGCRLGQWVSQWHPQASQWIYVPVPLHPSRLRERGYNQSFCIARGVVKKCGGKLLPHLLARVRATQSQTRLNRQQRLENVREAFRLMDYLENWLTAGAGVVLVDDVVTTGATLNECARVLKQGGASWVAGLTLATPPWDWG